MRAGILDSSFDIRKVRLENQIMELFMKFEKMQSEEEIMEEMNKMEKNHQNQYNQPYHQEKNPWTVLSLLILNQMNYHGLKKLLAKIGDFRVSIEEEE